MTLIPFTPSTTAAPPFQTTVTLDGVPYSLVTMWNGYRGDWYVSLTDQSGNLLTNQPLITSPDGYDIPLAAGLLSTSTLVFRASTQNFEQNP